MLFDFGLEIKGTFHKLRRQQKIQEEQEVINPNLGWQVKMSKGESF